MENEQEIRSPFKFLDPFDKGDVAIFFGREDEQEKIYQHVNKNRLVLIYGPSGSGKTSLVQCGLANRFEATDWVPFFIRRGKNINLSLRNILLQSKALGGSSTEEPYNFNQVVKAIERISTRYLRTVYLLFDQFEELLILGDEEEKNEFITTLQEIISSENTQSCNLLFILREEYFAWLDQFERLIPGFSDRRLRIEPMRPNKIAEVILKSCQSFHIKLEDPDKNAQQIIKVLSGKAGISLPYLQVYLDQLWREDFKHTLPDGWKGEGYAPLEFTTKEIEAFGQIKDVLDRFLSERKFAILQELKRLYDNVPDDTVGKVLDDFVTDEATKLPVAYTMAAENICLIGSVPEYLQQLPADLLTTCLLKLEKSRILRTDGDSFELAHDILAALIDQQRSDKQRRLNEIRRQIRSAHQEFQQTEQYPSSRQIAIYEDAIDQLKLDEKLIQFFRESKNYRKEKTNKKLKEAKRIAKEQRALRKKADESNVIAQRKTRQAKIRSRVAILIGIICLGLLLYLYYLNQMFQKSKENAQNQLARNYWNNSQKAIAEDNFLNALHFTAEAAAISKDEHLSENVLIDIETYLPVTNLTDILIHEAGIHKAVFSPDGKRILTANFDGTARLWEAGTGKQIGPSMKHEDAVYTAVFSADEKRILTASWNNTARLWEAGTGKQIGPSMQHDDAVYSAVFSDDGKRILTASKDSTARLWEAGTGKQIGPSMKHEDEVYTAVFSADEKRILTASSDKTARLWKAGAGKQIGPSMKHEKGVNSAVFSADGKRILTASRDKTARLWEADTGKQIGPSMNHEGEVYSAVFSDDGKRILTASRDQTARLWEAGAGKQIGPSMKHEDEVYTAVFSADEKRILTASSDKTVRLWEAGTGKQTGPSIEHEGAVRSAVFSGDGKRILTVSWDQTARVWEAGTGKQTGPSIEHEGAVRSAVFSDDGKWILTASFDSTARLWEAGTGKQIGRSMKHEADVNSAVFSGDGKRILTASRDTARLWEAGTGKQIGPSMEHEGWVNSAVFSADGRRILTASSDQTARLWEAGTGKQNGPSMKHEEGVNSAVFSGDGKRILTASDSTARLWEAGTGKQIGPSMKHGAYVYSAIFSDDGKRILTASWDYTARLWEAGTGKQIGPSMQHEDRVYSAVFSDDGKRILTASSDETARLWEAGTGKQIGPSMKHENWVFSAVFSGDGKRILTASYDRTARLWEAGTGKQIGPSMKHEDWVISAVFSDDGKRILTASDQTARLWNIGGDIDIPKDFLKLQAIATTGCKLNIETNETEVIPTDEWYKLREEYNNKAREHYKICKYPKYNLWRRFFPEEARKIRPNE